MDTKHTKGEWVIKSFSKSKEIRIAIDDANGNSIADVWALNDISFDEMKANAKLIAAAPDMLEALVKINEEIPNPTLPVTKVIKDIVQNAIKKATE